MHLIYARFFTYVMRDLGLIEANEPFKKLLNQGMVIKDGNKMSKSKGNTVSPDEMIEKYGADTARLFMLFASPPHADLEWNDEGVEGASRFLNRVWRKITGFIENSNSAFQNVKTDFEYEKLNDERKKLVRKVHRTIKKATNDIGQEQQFNTAVAALMELYNDLSSAGLDPEKDIKLIKFASENMVLLMAPIVPHFAEELWERMGNRNSIFRAKWPVYDEKLTVENDIEFVVQVGGKIRDRIKAGAGISQDEAEKMAMKSEKVGEWLKGKEVVKKIFVPDKLLNIVVK